MADIYIDSDKEVLKINGKCYYKVAGDLGYRTLQPNVIQDDFDDCRDCYETETIPAGTTHVVNQSIDNLRFKGDDGESAILVFNDGITIVNVEIGNVGGNFVFDIGNTNGLLHTFGPPPESYSFTIGTTNHTIKFDRLGSFIFNVAFNTNANPVPTTGLGESKTIDTSSDDLLGLEFAGSKVKVCIPHKTTSTPVCYEVSNPSTGPNGETLNNRNDLLNEIVRLINNGTGDTGSKADIIDGKFVIYDELPPHHSTVGCTFEVEDAGGFTNVIGFVDEVIIDSDKDGIPDYVDPDPYGRVGARVSGFKASNIPAAFGSPTDYLKVCVAGSCYESVQPPINTEGAFQDIVTLINNSMPSTGLRASYNQQLDGYYLEVWYPANNTLKPSLSVQYSVSNENNGVLTNGDSGGYKDLTDLTGDGLPDVDQDDPYNLKGGAAFLLDDKSIEDTFPKRSDDKIVVCVGTRCFESNTPATNKENALKEIAKKIKDAFLGGFIDYTAEYDEENDDLLILDPSTGLAPPNITCTISGGNGTSETLQGGIIPPKPLILDTVEIEGFSSPSEINGIYTKESNSVNGRPTYSNGKGWYMFWDGTKWIVTDTPYNKTGKYIEGGSELTDDFGEESSGEFQNQSGDSSTVITIGNLGGAFLNANGSYSVDGNSTLNGTTRIPTFSNGNGWYMFWASNVGKWIISDTAYNTSGLSIEDGSGADPENFSGSGFTGVTNVTKKVSGLTSPVQNANGTYTKDGNTKNGEPTLSNGNGWYQFWDEDTQQWVITDTPYDKTGIFIGTGKGSTSLTLDEKKGTGFKGLTGSGFPPGTVPGKAGVDPEELEISGLTGDFSNLNGTYIVTDSILNGKSVYKNETNLPDVTYMWFDGNTWVISTPGANKENTWVTNGKSKPGEGTFSPGIEITGFTQDKEGANGFYRDTGRKNEHGATVYENENGFEMVFDPERGGWVIQDGPPPAGSWIGSGGNSNPPSDLKFDLDVGGTNDWYGKGDGDSEESTNTGDTTNPEDATLFTFVRFEVTGPTDDTGPTVTEIIDSVDTVNNIISPPAPPSPPDLTQISSKSSESSSSKSSGSSSSISSSSSLSSRSSSSSVSSSASSESSSRSSESSESSSRSSESSSSASSDSSSSNSSSSKSSISSSSDSSVSSSSSKSSESSSSDSSSSKSSASSSSISSNSSSSKSPEFTRSMTIRGANTWSNFGGAVAVQPNGKYLIVGANEESHANTFSSNPYGVGYVEVYDVSGSSPVRLGSKIEGEGIQFHQEGFGTSVAISDEANPTIVVGAPFAFNDGTQAVGSQNVSWGCAYVYQYDTTTQDFVQKLRLPGNHGGTSGSGGNGAQMGNAVAISEDGEVVVMCEYNYMEWVSSASANRHMGQVHVYKRSGNTYVLRQTFKGGDSSVSLGERWGSVCAVNNDGSVIAFDKYDPTGRKIGAYMWNPNTSSYVDMYSYENSEVFVNNPSNDIHALPDALSISSNGFVMCVSAPKHEDSSGNEIGAVNVYDWDPLLKWFEYGTQDSKGPIKGTFVSNSNNFNNGRIYEGRINRQGTLVTVGRPAFKPSGTDFTGEILVYTGGRNGWSKTSVNAEGEKDADWIGTGSTAMPNWDDDMANIQFWVGDTSSGFGTTTSPLDHTGYVTKFTGLS